MIPLMKNAFYKEKQTTRALAEFIAGSPKLSMGEQCEAFEIAFAEFQNCSDCVLYNSGGSANLALIQAIMNLGYLQPGDAVGFSALTWATNVMPLIQLGLIAVPLDVAVDTLNVMQKDIVGRQEKIPLKAVFLTNVLGFSGDLPAIKSYCDEQNILVLEDNCEALGTVLPEGRTGNFGSASSFSFFVAHHMSSIEGGALCTDNGDLAAMLRMVRANGWDRNLTEEQQKRLRKSYKITDEFRDKYTFYDLGYNLRPTEITGFLGLNQLAILPENIDIRGKLYQELESAMLLNENFMRIDHSHIKTISPFSFPVICKDQELARQYMDVFKAAEVEIRPIISGNIQNQPFYKKHVKETYDTPGTDFIDRNGFYFGIYPELSEEDLATIKECFLK